MSDTRKSIVFNAKFDMSELSAAVDSVKRQMNQSNMSTKLNQQGMGGIIPLPSSNEILKARRELEGLVRVTSQNYELNNRALQKEKDLTKLLQGIKREELKDKEQIRKHDEKLLNNLERRLNLEKQLQQQQRLIGSGLGALGGGGGISNDMKALQGADWSRVMPKQTDFGNIAKGIGTFGAVITAISKTAELLAGFPMRVEEARGSSAQSFAGRDIANIASGASPYENAWLPERARAGGMAQSKRWWNRATDMGMGIGGAALLGGGAAAGMTGVGLPIAGAMMAGGTALLSNDRYRESLNPFSGRYNSLLDAQQGEDFQSTMENLKKQNPQKAAAIERLRGRGTGDLAFQRMTGMGYAGFGGMGGFAGAGGFQEQANMAGFNPDLAMAMSTQMMGAGGSTRGSRGGLSVLGLQAERGMGMTNAGGILGRISGTAGGSAASDAIFKRLLEESVRAGLDKSEFREEQRRFADNASEILSQSGVRTAQDAASVLAGFSKYLSSDPTVKGISGARSAYEQAQQFSAETSGRGGALQFAAFMKQPGLRRLGTMGLGGLAEMPDKDLNTSNPYIIATARSGGMTPQQVVDQAKMGKREKMLTELGLNPSAVDRLGTYLQNNGLASKHLGEGDINAMPNSVARTYADVYKRSRLRYGYAGAEQDEAAARGIIGVGPSGAVGGQVGAELAAPGGTPEDAAIRASGVAAQAMLENFRSFKDVITPASDSLKGFIDVVMSLNTAMALGLSNSAALSAYKGSLPRAYQTQAGKPVPRGSTGP